MSRADSHPEPGRAPRAHLRLHAPRSSHPPPAQPNQAPGKRERCVQSSDLLTFARRFLLHVQAALTTNKKVAHIRLCALLQNPFYIGKMVAGGATYPGTHAPLVTPELFERVQAVFRAKHGGKSSRQHHSFFLSRLVRCTNCQSLLVGESHLKKSGKAYRYYRCHRRVCRFYLKAGDLERSVIAELRALRLPERLMPLIRRRQRAAVRKNYQEQSTRVRELRAERQRLLAELTELRRRDDPYNREHLQSVEGSLRATEWLLARVSVSALETDSDQLLRMLDRLDQILESDDPVTRRDLLSYFVRAVHPDRPGSMLELGGEVQDLLRGTGSAPRSIPSARGLAKLLKQSGRTLVN